MYQYNKAYLFINYHLNTSFKPVSLPQLFEHDGHVELHGALVAVGLDAADEPGVAVAHRRQKLKIKRIHD